MARTNKTIYAILGILSVQPMSGYDIKQQLLRNIGKFWAESDGQIYPSLAKLQKNSLIKKQKTQTTGRRQKQIYAITPSGLKMLKAWLVEPAAEAVYRDEFTLKLFFGHQMSQQDYLAHIHREKEKMQKHLNYLLSVEQHIREEHLNKTKKTSYIPAAFYWLLTLKGGIYHTQTDIKWCEEVEKIIKNKKNKSTQK